MPRRPFNQKNGVYNMVTIQEINEQLRDQHAVRLTLWRAREKATIWQVSFLVMGINPPDVLPDEGEKPETYNDMKNLLIAAVRDKALPCDDDDVLDAQNKLVRLADVDTFFAKKHISGPFFNGSFMTAEQRAEPYLDPSHPHYAPKLAAAIAAWMAVFSDKTRLKGKTPKQAIEGWLKENADKYGLTKEDKTPNELGIEEISKIANWKTKGGAPKTPSGE